LGAVKNEGDGKWQSLYRVAGSGLGGVVLWREERGEAALKKVLIPT